MSALLTTTMPYMKVVIDTLAEKGLREDYIVLVGGAPLNEEFGQAWARMPTAAMPPRPPPPPCAWFKSAGWRRAPDLHGDARLCSGHRLRSLAREIGALKTANGWEHLDIQCLDARYITDPMRSGARRGCSSATPSNTITGFVAYADVGPVDGSMPCWALAGRTLTGRPCYELYATADVFHALADAEPGTFYLTDFWCGILIDW